MGSRSSPTQLTILILASVVALGIVLPVSSQVDVLPLTTRGDLLTRDATSIVRLGVGANNRLLRSNGTDPSWAQADLTTDVTGTLPLGNGGTGQTTATAAFNALDPLTTQGDVLYHNGTDSVRLAAGTNRFVLKSAGAAANPAWAPNGFMLMAQGGAATGHNPADSTDYFFGGQFFANPAVAIGNTGRISVPVNCVLVAVSFTSFQIAGVNGTSEAVTNSIQINGGATTVALTNTTFDAVNVTTVTTGLSTALTAGDYWQVKFTAPAWVTNPTIRFYAVTVYLEQT